jgi:ubiquinone/menaquinone biosynthesis C-methylase UbiE
LLPAVQQAQLLGKIFRHAVRDYSPASLALLGCAGGNGLEAIAASQDMRVVAIDINPDYVEKARSRFSTHFADTSFLTLDIEQAPLTIEPVDLMFAALIFEYVHAEQALQHIHPALTQGGVLRVVLQLPVAGKAAITPSPYSSLSALDGFMNLISPKQLVSWAEQTGFKLSKQNIRKTKPGKAFMVLDFVL